MLSFDWTWRRHRPRETQINPFWKNCSVLSKLKRLEARSTPLQEEEAVFGVGSALRACFKTLAFPLGGSRGVQRVHMWTLKAGTIFPSLPRLHMSYGIQLRPLKNKAIPSIFLCLLPILSQSNCLCPVLQCSSISCLHVPSQSMTAGYKRMQASVLADSVTGVLASQWVREGKNRDRKQYRERHTEPGLGLLDFGAHRILSSSLTPSISLPVSSKLPSLGVFPRQNPSQSPPAAVSRANKQWWWSSTLALHPTFLYLALPE